MVVTAPLAVGATASSSGSVWSDVHDFRLINGFARHTAWLHGPVAAYAQYGVVVFGVLVLAGWWVARGSHDLRRVAAAGLTAVAALVAVAVNQPIVHAVHEPRPFVALPHVLLLVHHAADPGYPSDHATMAGAVAVGLFYVSRRLGVVAAVCAVAIAFARVYVGVHFPHDVIAGLLLGGVVAFALVQALSPLTARLLRGLTRTPLRPVIDAPGRPSQPREPVAAGGDR